MAAPAVRAGPADAGDARAGGSRPSIRASPRPAAAASGRSCVNCTHLALLLAVFKAINIEERPFQGHTFQALVTLALLALPLHYLAPFRWKKPLFVAVSIAGLFWIAGAWAAAVVLAIAAVLIGVCYLPIPWLGRAAACAAIAAALALARPESASPRHPRLRLADRGLHVHVSNDYLSLRTQTCREAGVAGRHARLFLPPAELLLPALPGGRLPDDAARVTSPTTSTRPSGAGWR